MKREGDEEMKKMQYREKRDRVKRWSRNRERMARGRGCPNGIAEIYRKFTHIIQQFFLTQ